MKSAVTRSLSAVVLFGTFLLLTTGADHRDAPGLLTEPSADLNDVFAFVNGNSNNVVLVLTVNPFTAPGINAIFSPDVLYQFKIDNNGDNVEDLVIQVTFDEPQGPPNNPTQNFTVRGPAKPSKSGTINSILKSSSTISGPINNNPASNAFTTDASTGIKVFAGLRDDPFFFDSVYVTNVLNGVTNTRNPGIDFFAGVNVSAIAIELPPALLKGSSNNIRVWATTNLSSSDKRAIKAKKGQLPESADKGAKTFVQFDRTAIPALGTVLITKPHKDAFNYNVPATDAALFHQEIVDRLKIAPFNRTDTDAGALADALLPDILKLDVTSTAGFLNGRRPEDDVINAVLNLLTNGALTSDGVDANDVPFLTDFPFLAPPHTAHEGVPARN